MNIRSIHYNLKVFRDQCLNDMDKKFDILGFSETRLDKGITSLTGYRLYSINSCRYGWGICLYVCDFFNTRLLPECCNMESYFECICEEILEGNDRNLLASVYRPPKSNLSNFLNS